MPTLTTVALPRSTAGRKAEPLDEEFANALAAAVKKSGAKPDAKGNRPFHTANDLRYESKGKASAAGRRYADFVKETNGIEKVSVRVYPDGQKFGWGIYLPLPTEQETTTEA